MLLAVLPEPYLLAVSRQRDFHKGESAVSIAVRISLLPNLQSIINQREADHLGVYLCLQSAHEVRELQ